MFNEFLSIIFRSLKLDNSLYKDKKNFTESAFYFSFLIIILILIIQSIPNNVYINWMVELGLTKNIQIKFRETLFWGLFFVIIKSLYFYVIGKYIYQNKKKARTRRAL